VPFGVEQERHHGSLLQDVLERIPSPRRSP
jgi:hypothetical protein